MIHNLEQNCIDLSDSEDWFNKIDNLINIPLEECKIHEERDQEEGFYFIDNKEILSAIESTISVRLYHGCRIENFDLYKKDGLKRSEEDFNKFSFPKNIRKQIIGEELEQAKIKLGLFPKANSGRVYFCPTLESTIKMGGIYVIYGSEYRYRILTQLKNKIDKEDIFKSGVPSILVFDIPLNVINNDYLLNNLFRFYYKKKLSQNELIDKKTLEDFLKNLQEGQITSQSDIDFCYFRKIIFPKEVYVNNHFCNKAHAPRYYNFGESCTKQSLDKLEGYLKNQKIDFEFSH